MKYCRCKYSFYIKY